MASRLAPWRQALRALGAFCVLGAFGGAVPSCDPTGVQRIETRELECLDLPPRCPLEDYNDAWPCYSTGTGTCPDGYVCDSMNLTGFWYAECWDTDWCWPKCKCAEGDVCDDEGRCRLPPCDAPGSADCPAHFRCDPVAAQDDWAPPVGSIVPDNGNQLRVRSAGCVRKRCDEPDGFACEPRYACAPDGTNGPTGCVPHPCSETGLCQSEDYTCTPTGSHARGAPDPFGCVQRTCDDPGFVCPPYEQSIPDENWRVKADLPRSCDFSHPLADAQGCVLLACDAGGGCPEGYVCDAMTTPWTTANGCRNKSDRVPVEELPPALSCEP